MDLKQGGQGTKMNKLNEEQLRKKYPDYDRIMSMTLKDVLEKFQGMDMVKGNMRMIVTPQGLYIKRNFDFTPLSEPSVEGREE